MLFGLVNRFTPVWAGISYNWANGAGSGAGIRLSLYVRLMKDDNDDKLSFSFNASIKVQILNSTEPQGEDYWTL